MGRCLDGMELIFVSYERREEGVCHTLQECSQMQGTPGGSCAMGFGTCCVFSVTDPATQGRIRRNMTYIQNPGFPSDVTNLSVLNNQGEQNYGINKLGRGTI